MERKLAAGHFIPQPRCYLWERSLIYLREDCGRRLTVVSLPPRALWNGRRKGEGSNREVPWVCDGRGGWVTKRSQRRAQREKRCRKSHHGCDAGWGGGGAAGRSLPVHSLGAGHGPITAAVMGPVGGGQDSSQAAVGEGTIVGIPGLL